MGILVGQLDIHMPINGHIGRVGVAVLDPLKSLVDVDERQV